MPDPIISVLHLDDGRTWRGGQHQVSLLAQGLAARGIPQKVLAPKGSPLSKNLKEAGVVVQDLSFSGELDFLVSRTLARLARTEGTTVLHAHTAHMHTIGIRAKKLFDRNGDGPPVRLVISRRVDFPVGRGYFSGQKYRYADQHFIAISESVRDVLIAGGVAAERIDLVRSGVPPLEAAASSTRTELGIGDDEFAIVNVGALTDHKGQRWLIGAFPKILKQIPNASLWILGEGELRGDLERQVADLGLSERVHLPGYIDQAREKLSGFDLYVSSSHLEGLGTSTLDAMLAGLPVVATDAGGVAEIVHDGKTGWLVAAKDANALAEGVMNAHGASDEERAKIVDQAKRHAGEHFSVDQMVEGTLATYRKVLGIS